MSEREIRKLIKLVEESQIDSLEIRRLFRTIRITKTRLADNHHPDSAAHATLVNVPVPQAIVTPATTAVTHPVADAAVRTGLIEIKSPMVGTFYRAPAPTAPHFVEPNQIVKPGDTLCIIEAMKLMNEIEAEQGGRIVKILVENAQPVEFGQVMFLLDPSAV